jgi:hypothetical protein
MDVVEWAEPTPPHPSISFDRDGLFHTLKYPPDCIAPCIGYNAEQLFESPR